MQVRNTVDTGRTVTCTIHQPSIDIFEVNLAALSLPIVMVSALLCPSAMSVELAVHGHVYVVGSLAGMHDSLSGACVVQKSQGQCDVNSTHARPSTIARSSTAST